MICDIILHKNKGWKLEVGEYLREKKAPTQQEVSVIAYSLLFSGVSQSMAAKA